MRDCKDRVLAESLFSSDTKGGAAFSIKVSIAAAMRKLIIIANSVAKRGT